MRLSDFLEPDLVIPDLRTDGVGPTIRALASHLEGTGRIQDVEAVVTALEGREASHSTSLGNGVALPHSTIPGLEKPVVLVARAPEGVSFGSAGEERVRLFFILLSPEEQAGTHIKLLARVVRLVRRSDFLRTIMEAGDSTALLAAVHQFDASHS